MIQQIFPISIFIILIGVCNNAFAQQDSVSEDEKSISSEQSDIDDSESGSVVEMVFGKLDITHTSISSGLEETASSIDDFFADDKVFEQTNQSYLRIALDMVSKEYDGTGFAGDLKLKVDLPKIKKRLKLLIESDSQRDSNEKLDELPTDVVQERDFFISLEKQIGDGEKWDVRPSLGIKLHRPVDPFTRLRTHRYFALGNWLMLASNRLSWYDSRGYGANAVMEFDRAITKVILFRSTSTLHWQEEEMFRRIDQSLSLYQQIDARRNMAYQVSAFADDENEWRANKYNMRVRYRKRLYKKWMFGEIIPQLSFLKETGFHPESSITFRLEMVFGERYR